MKSNKMETEPVLSDREIIERITAGSQREYAVIIDRYKDRAMALALRMLRNREDAEEAIQDAFVRAFRGLKNFRGASRFGTWLYRIVYNVCLSRLGRRKEEFLSLDVDDGATDLGGDPAWIHHAELETADMAAFVRRAMESLPAKYSTVLSLFYLQELSLEEVSSVMAIPIGTVKVRLHRARGLLLNEVEKESRVVREPI